MTQSASLARKLSAGLYGRLEFDFACNRGHAFGEAHLHGVLMEILASNVDPRAVNVKPSHALDAIQRADSTIKRTPRKNGRKREVDFAVLTRAQTPELLYCIEAKWAGSSHATAANILVDLTRLAIISEEHPEAVCLFLLAGGKDEVEKLLNSRIPALSQRKVGDPLLRYPYDSKSNAFNLKNGPGRHRAELDVRRLEALAERFRSTPDRIRTFLYKPSHDTPPNWNVQVWRVSSHPYRRG